MLFNNFELMILIRNQPIVEYFTNEQTPRSFVEGRPGSVYELQLRNHNFSSIEVIVSVDGLAVTDGKPADSESLGFILPPRETIKIPGWLLDATSAATFVFAAKHNGYAAQSGAATCNIGVIGAMAFTERSPPRAPSYTFIQTGSNGGYVAPAPIEASSASIQSEPIYPETQGQSVATGFGDATPFRTTTVRFQRGMALGTLLIYYDDRRGLKARGIVLERQRALPRTPDAFPGKRSACVPPCGWIG
jgi:hypothetical protein